MTRYIAETHAPEATGSIKARVIDTHDADTIVAWTQTTERAESIAALLNYAEQRTKSKRPDGIDAQGMGDGRTLVVQPKNHRAPR